jgi:hypothetical protein
MKQYPVIAQALDTIHGQIQELNEAMKLRADINYLSLNDLATCEKRTREALEVTVRTRRFDN